jgi:DnaJ-domain-containing protein 1
MEQIELREKLADIRETDQVSVALEKLKEDASLRYTEIQEMFEGQYNKNDFQVAFDSLAKMQFVSKFLDEIERLEEELDDF